MIGTTRSPHSADWQAWGRHMAAAAIKGAALAVKTSGVLTAAGTIAEKPVDLHVLAYAALGGFIWAVVDFLSAQPFPTAQEENP